MSLSSLAAAAETAPDPVLPFIIAGVAFLVFLTLGVVAWSYRDVANRHSHKVGNDSHSSGH
jgi:hypothetical protein